MENEELLRRIEQLENEIKLLKAATTIPHDVEQAFRERFRLSSFTAIEGSAKGATSENQTVSESGSSTYSVLTAPDAFLQVTIGVTTYYIPVFT